MADEPHSNPLSPAHPSLTLLRAHNGWLIRAIDYARQGYETPYAVAETPELLAELVKTWACAQVLEADKAKNRLRGD